MLQNLSKYRTELMGISILWIMLFHAGFQAPDNIVLRSLWYFFISFGGGLGVPIFLILSGMGLMFSELRNSHATKWRIYVNKRIVRIIPAYIIVATTYYLIKGESVYNLVFLNLILEGQRDFWYIAAILLCYAIFPFVVALCRKFKPVMVLVGLSVLCWIIAFCLDLSVHNLYTNVEILIHRVPCFLIGVYVGYLLYNKMSVQYITLNISCLAAGGVILLLPFRFLGDMRWTFTLISVPILYIIAAIIPYLKQVDKVIYYFGKRSLEVYLVHVSFGNLLLNGFPNHPSAELILYFVCSIIIAEPIYKLDNIIRRKYESKCYNTGLQC